MMLNLIRLAPPQSAFSALRGSHIDGKAAAFLAANSRGDLRQQGWTTWLFDAFRVEKFAMKSTVLLLIESE